MDECIFRSTFHSVKFYVMCVTYDIEMSTRFCLLLLFHRNIIDRNIPYHVSETTKTRSMEFYEHKSECKRMTLNVALLRNDAMCNKHDCNKM